MTVKFYEAYKVEAGSAKGVRYHQIFTFHNARFHPIAGRIGIIEGMFDINDAL